MGDLIHKRDNFLQKKENFLATYDVRKCTTKFMSVTSAKKALIMYEDEVSLSSIRKMHGDVFVLKYIELWILDLNEYFSIKIKMNNMQRQEAAVFIYQEYYYLKIPELFYVFSNAKKGRYGEIYNALDGAKILSWFRKYNEERCIEIEKLAAEQKDQVNNIYNNIPDKLVEMVKPILEEKYKEKHMEQVKSSQRLMSKLRRKGKIQKEINIKHRIFVYASLRRCQDERN